MRFLFFVIALFAGAYSTTIHAQSYLEPGQTLDRGQVLRSASGQYELHFQTDGNLAFYGPGGQYIWDAQTQGRGHRFTLQTDGNLVIYDIKNQAVWSSETHPYFDSRFNSQNWKPSWLEVLDNGQFALYSETGNIAWARPETPASNGSTKGKKEESYTAPLYDKMIAGNRLLQGQELVSASGAVRLRMQYDGNLAMYNNGQYLWDARTAGRGSYLTLQDDGNLVIYATDGQAVWSSQTHPYFDSRYRNPINKTVELNLLNNGTFVLLNTRGSIMWTNQ
ncbi:MAG: hypothetical protein AAFY36_04975 [Bacteroidota bacterium]